MTYLPKNALPHPTGLHRGKFEEIRKHRGLEERGFPVKREPESKEGGRAERIQRPMTRGIAPFQSINLLKCTMENVAKVPWKERSLFR